jgi:RNA polymerase sigma-70 factor (ECF subfamily)
MRTPFSELALTDSPHADDLALAAACAKGDRIALGKLDRILSEAVPRAAARLKASNAFIDEVKQLLRHKLFVADPARNARPKILDYQGRGPLAQWLRASALRVALNLLEAQGGTRALANDEGPVARLHSPGPDPELSLVKRRYGPEFRAALEAALLGLGAKERAILRLYFAQGMTVEEIGRLEGTHKSTISRWLTRMRASLLADVRARLQEKLGLGAAELDSLLNALGSQLHVSLARVL